MYANQLAPSGGAARATISSASCMQAEVDGEQLTEAGLRRLLPAARRRRQRDDAQPDLRRMLALIEHPEQRARLIADPALMPTAVEEMLRWVSPVIYFRRTRTRDIEVARPADPRRRQGRHLLPLGNRDEEIFADADAFDVGRTPNEHMAFGGGGRTSASAPAWRGWRSASCSRSCCARLPDIELGGPVAAAALELHQRHQAHAGAIHAGARVAHAHETL